MRQDLAARAVAAHDGGGHQRLAVAGGQAVEGRRTARRCPGRWRRRPRPSWRPPTMRPRAWVKPVAAHEPGAGLEVAPGRRPAAARVGPAARVTLRRDAEHPRRYAAIGRVGGEEGRSPSPGTSAPWRRCPPSPLSIDLPPADAVVEVPVLEGRGRRAAEADAAPRAGTEPQRGQPGLPRRERQRRSGRPRGPTDSAADRERQAVTQRGALDLA